MSPGERDGEDRSCAHVQEGQNTGELIIPIGFKKRGLGVEAPALIKRGKGGHGSGVTKSQKEYNIVAGEGSAENKRGAEVGGVIYRCLKKSV